MSLTSDSGRVFVEESDDEISNSVPNKVRVLGNCRIVVENDLNHISKHKASIEEYVFQNSSSCNQSTIV